MATVTNQEGKEEQNELSEFLAEESPEVFDPEEVLIKKQLHKRVNCFCYKGFPVEAIQEEGILC